MSLHSPVLAASVDFSTSAYLTWTQCCLISSSTFYKQNKSIKGQVIFIIHDEHNFGVKAFVQMIKNFQSKMKCFPDLLVNFTRLILVQDASCVNITKLWEHCLSFNLSSNITSKQIHWVPIKALQAAGTDVGHVDVPQNSAVSEGYFLTWSCFVSCQLEFRPHLLPLACKPIKVFQQNFF